MGAIEVLSRHRQRRSDEIAGTVALALKCLGGAAHLDTLAAAVEAKLRTEKGDSFRNIASDVEAALHAFDLDNAERARPAQFRRPFGLGSKRWALHEDCSCAVVAKPMAHRTAD